MRRRTRCLTGRKLIILNPTHGSNRQNATLDGRGLPRLPRPQAEPPRRSRRRDKNGKIIARDYNHAIEEEAYSTGAAALVPYTSLKRMVEAGRTSREIARHFYVSRALVEYRIKVSRLWDTYKERVFQGE